MGRPRKSLSELKMSGTYQVNKKKYSHLLEAPIPAPVRPLGRVPAYLTKDEKACWKEIAGSGADVVLGFGDRLSLEVVSKLLAKSRREELKPGQLTSLSNQLAKLQSKGQAASAVESVPNPDEELSEFDKFFADDAEDSRRKVLIDAESQRRRDAGPIKGQTAKDFEYYCRWYEVRLDLEKKHKWKPLYV